MRSEAPEMRERLLMSRSGRFVVFAAALVLAGCFGSSRKPPDPLPASTGGVRVSQLWRVALDGDSGIGFAPVAIGDSVWAASKKGVLTRVDIDTGRARWRTVTGKTLTAGVGTDGLVSVVATIHGEILAYDVDGQFKWSAQIGAEIVTPPAVADGTVLLRTTDNRVLAFDSDNGNRRWTFQRQNPPLVLRQSGGVAMVPSLGYIGMPGGRLVALGLSSGSPRWDVPLAQPRGATELERMADVVGTPLIIGQELCAATYQGRVGCLNAANGEPIWTKDFSSAVGLDVDGQGVVLPDANDIVHAFDRAGAPVWQQKGLARRRLSAPLIAARSVAFGDFQGNVLWLSRDDGTLSAVRTTDGKAIVAPPTAIGSILVVQTSGGTLHAFRVE
jgi:outer membrane protein assembly factor BamB